MVWLTPSGAVSFDCNQLNSQDLNTTLARCVNHKWSTAGDPVHVVTLQQKCCNLLDMQCIRIKMV